MLKRQKKLWAVWMTLVLLVSFVPAAYGDTAPQFDVWVPTNTEKVMRDQRFPSDGSNVNANAEMKLGSARNEYESGQVIVKAGADRLRKLQVSISELKQTEGPAKISKEHIQLFKQHYIEVKTSTMAAYPKGWYPDALIPLNGDEQLQVPAGQNQGIWFKIYVPKGQPSGRYTGEITLHETGNPVRIPVELTVWDFELTDESHSKTAFTVWGGPIQEAHGNVVGEEAWRYIEKYYWASVEHRLSPSYLPIPDSDLNAYADNAGRFVNDPRVSAYRLPYYKTAQGEPDVARMKQLVDLLREKGLLSKAYFYIGEIDEPTPDKYARVKQINDALQQAAPDVPHLVTIQPVDELVGNLDIWTADIEKFDPQFAKERQAAGDHVWWYTYVKPKHPFPSYHLDDDLVGTRLLTWMQRDRGVEGTLYWATTQFQKYDSAQKKYVSRDVWTDPLAFPGANGDGYLFYPGTAVGVDGPIATIRLEVLRESMEDYEYLWQYEQRLQQAAAKLGIAELFSYGDALRPFYDRLYENIRMFEENPANLLQVRSEIAAEIAASETPLLVTVQAPASGSREVSVYAEKGSQVTINGMPVPVVEQGAGYDRYGLVMELTQGVHEIEIAVSKDGITRTANRKLAVHEAAAPYKVELNDVETDADIKRFTTSTVTLSRSANHVTSGNYSMQAVFRANVNFPNFRLFDAGKGFRSADWSGFEALEIDVYNPGETAQFYVKFSQTNGAADDTHMIYVRPGQTETIRIPLREVNLNLTQMRGIEIWAWRHANPVTLIFDNFRFTSAQPADPMSL